MKKILNRFAKWLKRKTAGEDAPAYDVGHRLLNLRINNLDDRLLKVEDKISNTRAVPYVPHAVETPKPDRPANKLEDPVDCATCGCMVRKGVAVKGKGEIRKTPEVAKAMHAIWGNIACATGGSQPASLEDEFIYYPYYCKRCAPKNKKCEG